MLRSNATGRRHRSRRRHSPLVPRPTRMPHSGRRHPGPQVSFHILLALRLIGDHLRATPNVRRGNSIADRRAGRGFRPVAKTHRGSRPRGLTGGDLPPQRLPKSELARKHLLCAQYNAWRRGKWRSFHQRNLGDRHSAAETNGTSHTSDAAPSLGTTSKRRRWNAPSVERCPIEIIVERFRRSCSSR